MVRPELIRICFKIETIGEYRRNDTRPMSGMHVGPENERVNRRGFLKASAVLALSFVALAACARERVTLHYKLSIVVEIDGQQYEGASVVETKFADRRGSPWLLPDMPEVVANSRGEAVIVDLREHGLLFGLLTPPNGIAGFNGVQPQSALSRCLPPAQRSVRQNFLRNIQAFQGECELISDDRPPLVRFRDISDPSSAELVEFDRLSEVYGAGAVFVRATIAVTRDSITDPAMDRTLPWLAGVRGIPGNKPGRDPMRRISERTMSERLVPMNFSFAYF